MQIVFMGTPDFAVPSLQALLDAEHEVLAVFTQSDKPKGRGHRLQPPPVKELAESRGIPVFQPPTLRSEQVVSQLAALRPEVIVVVAYGKILPKEILSMPPFGCVNVHGSLLPRYRGAAPVQWSVIHGDKTAGVTTMLMEEGVDTGDILLQGETPVGEEETAGELFDRLKMIGAQLLVRTLQQLEDGTLKPVPQREEDATPAPMLTKEMAQLDWNRPARELHDLIRGLNPWPCAYATNMEGKKLKIHASKIIPGWGGEPGTLRALSEGIAVACGEGALLLTQLQPESGKRMDGKSYLMGHPLGPAEKFKKP